MNGLRIGFFGKGGSGKSTVVSLMAKALTNSEYRVCVIDADSTNIGLAQALGFKETPRPLIDYFGGMVFGGGLVTCPVDDPTPLQNAEIDAGHLPPEFWVHSDKGVTLLLTGKIGVLGPGAGCDGPLAKIARDFRFRQKEPVVTLLDFKAGFEDVARGVVTSLDWVVVVIDPTTASLELARSLKSLIQEIKGGALPATKHLPAELTAVADAHYKRNHLNDALFILNKVRGRRIEEFMRRELEGHGIQPAAVLHEEAAITECWLEGSPIFMPKLVAEAAHVVHQLESAP